MFWNIKKFTAERISLRMLRSSPKALNPLTQEQIKQRVMLAVLNQPASAKEELTVIPFRFHFAKLASVSLFGVLAIFGTAYAATVSNPGDPLYSVKRAQENVRLNLAPTEESKANLQASFAQERILEYKNVEKKHNSGITPKIVDNKSNSIKTNAKKEVKTALQNLTTTAEHLKKQGKAKAAVSVQENIKRINLEAKEQNLIEEPGED